MKDKKRDNFKVRDPSPCGIHQKGAARGGIPNGESEVQNKNSGTLFVVSTPIGNLEDITLRALRILKSVDLIAAENMRHSKGLCHHYGINTRLTGYHQHNQKIKGPKLLKKIKAGSDIALITNAGTPAVSDPGGMLVNQAIEENIKVSPIPGPSAVIAALSVSGLRSDRFLFLGFLSRRASKRRRELQGLISEPRPMVFFESPHRLESMLTDIKEVLGDRHIVLLREMTKVYEEVKRGLVGSVLKKLEDDKIKGEFTLVVAGKEKGKSDHPLDRRTQKRIGKLMNEKEMGVKEIASQLSGEEGLTYRAVYKECLAIKRAMRPSKEVTKR